MFNKIYKNHIISAFEIKNQELSNEAKHLLNVTIALTQLRIMSIFLKREKHDLFIFRDKMKHHDKLTNY